jgi:hypothetical protein
MKTADTRIKKGEKDIVCSPHTAADKPPPQIVPLMDTDLDIIERDLDKDVRLEYQDRKAREKR